jgi:hypothetical protein
MPEIDFSTARVLGRGRHVEKAKRAFAEFETVAIEKSVLKALGGPEGLNEILQVLAKTIGLAKKKRRAA